MGLPELDQLTMTEQSWFGEKNGEGGRARLVVLAAEVGGRWSGETAKFFAALDAKAQSCPFILQNRVKAAYVRRWSAVLACSAARAFTTSLLDRWDAPSVHEVVRDARFGWRRAVCISL